VLSLHARRIVIAADGDAGDTRLPQPRQFLGNIRPVAVGGRLVIEKIADMGKDPRMVRNGILYCGIKCLTQSFAPLLAPLWCQTWQSWGEMVVACHDDADR
jgi:hypothetical protein